MARMEVEIDLERLAWQFAEELNDAALTAFILEIDEARADLQFTKRLRVRLDRVIEEEENGTD